jgi:hypothetical protein
MSDPKSFQHRRSIDLALSITEAEGSRTPLSITASVVPHRALPVQITC